MKRLLGSLLFVLAITIATAQTPAQNAATQGDQEIFWAMELFKTQYKPQSYKKYSGKIKVIDDHNLQFGNKSVEFRGADTLLEVFAIGLLYPALLGPGEPRITAIAEAYYAGYTPQVRRFRLDVVHKGYNNSQGWATNPTIYFFELTNNRASAKTDIHDFIKGAKLTFLKEGWVQK